MEDVEDVMGRARELYKAGKFKEAIAEYDNAININSQFAPAYHSKALARLNLKEYSLAIADAEKAVELSGRLNARYFSTLGTAYYEGGNKAAAKKAWEEGLKLDPKQPNCLNGISLLNRPRPTYRPTPPNDGFLPTRPIVAELPLAQMIERGKANQGTTYLIAACGRLAMLALLAGYILSPGKFSYQCWRLYMLSAMASHISSLFITHGVPQFNLESLKIWGSKVLEDTGSPSLMLPMLVYFMIGRPNPFGMLAVGIADLWYALEGLHSLLANVPVVPSTLSMLGNKVLPYVGGNSNRNLILSNLLYLSALAEIALGILLIFEVFTPARNLLATIIFWQTFPQRYVTSPAVRKAFGTVNTGLRHYVIDQPWCPAVVKNGYDKMSTTMDGYVRGIVQNAMGQAPQAEAAQGGLAGMMSKCEIM